MRPLRRSIFELWPEESNRLPFIVNNFREKYRVLSNNLDRFPVILDLIAKDLSVLSEERTGRGRNAVLTVENIFRAIVVKQMEGFTYRQTCQELGNNIVFQNFCRMDKKASMDHGLLCKAFKAIRDETWQTINRLVVIECHHDGTIEDPDTIRTDSTVVECDVHYPTDASLLWDSYSQMAKRICRLRPFAPELTAIRFHLKKIKKIYLDITRFSNTKNKKRTRQLVAWKKDLTARVAATAEKTQALCKLLANNKQIAKNKRAKNDFAWLQDRLPVIFQIIDVAARRVSGENVPVEDKIMSLFEPHTELIIRGRREKPLEFGHKLLLTQTKDKIITDYQVLAKNVSDSKLLETVLDHHQEIFGKDPKNVAADMGFCPEQDEYEELEERVEYLKVPKRLRDFGDVIMTSAQMFRAGIEGSISCLKRAYRLSRCYFRGFKDFCSGIGSAIFCHNMVQIGRRK